MTEKDTHHGLVPRLRFPEFRDAPGWDSKALERVCDLKAGDFVRADAIADKRGEGMFPCYGGNGLRGYVTTFTHSGRFVLIGRQGALCGNVNLFDEKFHATEHALVATPKPNIYIEWLFYSLAGLNLNRFAIGQAQPGLSVSVLNSVDVFVPIDQAEQQKIAACLGSLDDLIAAEGRKLTGLRDHKKGLMQQLFPREGETRPRLRFPEFQDAPEWETRKISSVLAKKAEPATLDDNGIYREIGVRSHGKGLFHKEATTGKAIGAKRVFHVVPDALVINIVFAWEQALAVTTQDEVEFIASHRFPMFVPKANRCDVAFIQRLFLMPVGKQLLKVASPGGAGRNRTLSQKEFENLDVVIPSTAEQQRIADCLSSLDAMIAAQAEKLDALRTHKRGLMQQLFPSEKCEVRSEKGGGRT